MAKLYISKIYVSFLKLLYSESSNVNNLRRNPINIMKNILISIFSFDAFDINRMYIVNAYFGFCSKS